MLNQIFCSCLTKGFQMFSSLSKQVKLVPNGSSVSITALKLCQVALHSNLNPRDLVSTTSVLHTANTHSFRPYASCA